MPGKILGLDIKDDSIAAVQVTSTLKGYQITRCAQVTLGGDTGMEEALKDLFDRYNLKSDVCHSSIAERYASYRNLELPFKDPRKIRQTLPFELEAMVPFPIEDLLVDFIFSDMRDRKNVLAASVKKGFISKQLKLLRPHGVDPDALDIRCIPMVSWLLKQEETPENGLFLQLDGKRNTMVLFLEKRIALIRTFFFDDTPGAGTASDALTHDHMDSQNSGPEDASYYTWLCSQVQTTVHNFGLLKNRVIQPEKTLLSGNSDILVAAANSLSRVLDIPAEPIDLSKNEKIHMHADVAETWDPSRMNNALALALRDTRQDQGFNFRKDEFEKKKHYLGPKKEIRKAAVLFIILLFFLSANLGIDYYFLKKRHDGLSSRITAVFKETFPHVTRIPRDQELNMMKGEINKIKKSAGSLPTAGRKTGVLELLTDISKRIPTVLDVHLTRMILDAEAVRLSGKTDTFNTVDKIKNNLESSECFKTATISSAKLDRTGSRVEFEIKLERAG